MSLAVRRGLGELGELSALVPVLTRLAPLLGRLGEFAPLGCSPKSR